MAGTFAEVDSSSVSQLFEGTKEAAGHRMQLSGKGCQHKSLRTAAEKWALRKPSADGRA